SAGDPLKLALQRSDMPPTVQNHILGPPKPEREDPEGLRSHGTGLRGARYTYSWPGRKKGAGLGDWQLEGKVIVAPSRAAAQKVSQDATKLRFGLLDLLYPPHHQAQLSLASYGEEQLGMVGDSGEGPEATLFARRGAVVWGLHIFHSPQQWKVTRAQVLVQLKAYAHKQAARVGTG